VKRKVENWSIERIVKERTRISFPEYQRQPNLWSEGKKILLIDSIFQDIDIPKLYFNKTTKDSYEVVDGQQRLWSIWDYLDDGYVCKINGTAKKFSALTPDRKTQIKNYELQITVIENADDDYLRELFIRLQLGLLLITGEKLHAATGKMKDFVFAKLPKDAFIAKLGIPARRYAKETLCAQICINSFRHARLGTFARTRYEDLQYFFQEYERPQGGQLDFFQTQTKKIERTMEQLWQCFGEKTKELKNRSYVLSVYLFLEETMQQNKPISQAQQKMFSEFILKLWRRLREEAAAGFDRRNRELYSFETLVSSAPGERYQIERRHTKLEEYYTYYQKTEKIKGD